MNRISIIITVITFQLLSLGIYAQTKETHIPLTFNVTGFADNSGQLLVYLYRKEDKIPSDPFKILEIKIDNKKAFVKIDDLPLGDYACIFIHDQNANNRIDHSFGIPSEPLGYTNNWKLSLFSGMPTFERLRFTYNVSKNNYVINMDEK
ncbi:DUF2141 domain-containing protein [Mariniflexile sp. HMF6888]|uniref:DUF2141 domain-containing protein n=1 Tax=Mariniflexile sp. HMF6888 TaxID=3373086 RepID=UPI0037AA8AD1